MRMTFMLITPLIIITMINIIMSMISCTLFMSMIMGMCIVLITILGFGYFSFKICNC